MTAITTSDGGVARTAKIPHPYLVLATAVLLPGFGHVLCGRARRGLTLQLFMLCIGFITWQLTTPDRSLIGRLAGGLFIYALSIPDAYRTARIRWAERNAAA
jgi:hypothetical protein